MAALDVARALDAAKSAVAAGASAALRRRGRGLHVELKSDRTPVTEADKEAEAAIVAVLHAAFPTHGILTEEAGMTPGDASQWIVDPIDGTRGFARGGPFWGPLVALRHDGEIVAGAMALPALGERYWAARGLGAFLEREGSAPARLRVSDVARWDEATLSLGELRCLLQPPLGERVAALAASSAQTRSYGDLAGCAMVLSGRAEAWVESGVQVWDIAALAILVEEAGGTFTDFSGRRTVDAGECVASNGLVHAHLLANLRARSED